MSLQRNERSFRCVIIVLGDRPFSKHHHHYKWINIVSVIQWGHSVTPIERFQVWSSQWTTPRFSMILGCHADIYRNNRNSYFISSTHSLKSECCFWWWRPRMACHLIYDHRLAVDCGDCQSIKRATDTPTLWLSVCLSASIQAGAKRRHIEIKVVSHRLSCLCSTVFFWSTIPSVWEECSCDLCETISQKPIVVHRLQPPDDYRHKSQEIVPIILLAFIDWEGTATDTDPSVRRESQFPI